MLDRASMALRVAETSYKAGASSLLELLEARRTYIETNGNYLRAQHDYRQSIIDLYHSIGGRAQ
jgi:cobalt-zinc-cadmium efflux system outer membrane protein